MSNASPWQWFMQRMIFLWQFTVMALVPVLMVAIGWALVGGGWYLMTKNDPGALVLRGLVAEVMK